jgi:putative heme-binding domain-containing protein
MILAPLLLALAAQDPDDPENERRALQLAEGYEVGLFASEKEGVVKPVQIRWDPRGRLWVACTPTYPQIVPGEKADDRIVVLEDADGDGRADRSTVFAGGMNHIMGLELGDGGVYVGQGAELLHLKDTDGDGRADERRVVLRGFGTGDSHQIINNFAWSPGGELWFCQGLHAYSRVETPWGVEKLDQAAVWRFYPRRLRLDGLLHNSMGPQNPWGIAFDDWGQPVMFAGNGQGVYYLTPALVRTRHFLSLAQIWDKTHKLSGPDVLSGRHLPEEVHGLFVSGSYLNNRVLWFRLTEDGAGFRAKDLPPLVVSTDTSFRPVDVKVGPDGAIYVCDWFNPVIGHYQASFRHPSRDKTRGRIWRITARGRPLVERPKLVGLAASALLERLKSPERWERHQARRLLADLDGADAARAVGEWAARIEDDRLLFEAVAALETHEVVEPRLLSRLARAADPRARAYAARVAGRWQDRLADPLALLSRLVADDHPRVRLEAVAAAGAVPSPRSVEVAAISVDRPMDRFIAYALTQAVHATKPHWKPAFEAGKLTFGNDARRLEFALKADGSQDALGPLVALARSGRIEGASRSEVLALVAELGGPDELAVVLAERADLRLLGALAEAAARRGVRPSGDLEGPLREILRSPRREVRDAAIRLGGAWKLEALRGEIEEAAREGSGAAMEALADLGAAAVLSRLAADGLVPAVGALARLDLKVAAAHGGRLVERDPAAVVGAFLAREGGAEALAGAGMILSPDAAKLALRAMSSAGRSDKALWDVLHKAAGLAPGAPPYDAGRAKALAAEAAAKGDPARGERVFRGAFTNCLACHAIGGAGGNVGPDLSAAGTALPADMLVEAVLWPRKQVKENYFSVLVATKDGRVLQGYRVHQDREVLAIREVETDQVRRIPLDRIQATQEVGSNMPEGLTAGLTEAELRDLIRFLSELGRPGSFRVDDAPVVRRWRVAAGDSEPPADSPLWTARYSTAAGALPMADLPDGRVWARFELEVLSAGKVRFEPNSAEGLSIAPELDLAAGLRWVVVSIDRSRRTADLRILCEPAGARFRLVSGK